MAQEHNLNPITHRQKYFVCYQCCFWIAQLLIIALGITVMAKVIIGYQITKEVIESNQYLHSEETVWLWNKGYIIDIKAEKTNNCPEGYYPLVNYTWPGSADGCYCNSNQNGYAFDFVMQGKCSSELIAQGCSTVSAMGSEVMNMWKGSSLLCYKRADSMTFYNSVIKNAPPGGSSSNMTSCGDNQAYQVYTLPGVECPITAVSNATVGTSQVTLTLDSTHGNILNFINKTNYPIADFKLTQYQYCEFFNTTNISPNKKGTYILENSNLTDPCSTTDPRMVTIDSIDELDLYTNNTRVYQLIGSLPGYPQPSIDYSYQLGLIHYPTWTYACRSNNDYNLYKATDKLLFKGPKDALVLSVSVTIVCVLVLVLLLRLFFIIRHIVQLKTRSTYNALMLQDQQIAEQMPNIDIGKSYKKQCLIFSIQLLLLSGIAASIIYSITILTHESVWIKQITKVKCTDSYLQNIFYYYEQKIDKISSLLIESIFIWTALAITQVAIFISRNYIGDLHATVQNQTEKEPSVNQEEINPIDKELKEIPNQSSEIILQKEQSSAIKVYDMEELMGDFGGGGETKSNFYGSLDREASLNVSKKKKKKRITNKKKKNLIPQDEV